MADLGAVGTGLTLGQRAGGDAKIGEAAAPREADGFRAARESRANDALMMKDEQVRILAAENSQLLSNLDRVEQEASGIHLEKLAADEENRILQEQAFELQSKAHAADEQLRKAQAGSAERDRQLRIMEDQNAELLRLLEAEEARSAKLGRDIDASRRELETLRGTHSSLLATAKAHEEAASRAAREGELRAEEARLLGAEAEQLRQQNAELKRRSQVEVEALQEQLRLRREKQYEMLERLQGHEESKRQAEDQASAMEETVRTLRATIAEKDMQLHVERRSRVAQENTNKKLLADVEKAHRTKRELQSTVEQSEQDRLRMEAAARDSSEQLREMAEKVFQLLERLKLAELGKSKNVEALRKREREVLTIKKRAARLTKEKTQEGEARAKAELDKKVLSDQIRALKKHNAKLGQRCREEVKQRMKEEEEKRKALEKVKAHGGRLQFLLRKMQSDEEIRVVNKEEGKRMEAQIRALAARNDELQRKLVETGESNRAIAQEVRVKSDALEQLEIKHDALSQLALEKEKELAEETEQPLGAEAPEGGAGVPSRERFYVKWKPAVGLLQLQGRKVAHRAWLEEKGAIAFLRRAQMGARFKEAVIEHVAHLYGAMMVDGEDRDALQASLGKLERSIELLQRRNALLQDRLGMEEDAKRRTLLRYVRAVDTAATLGAARTRIGGAPLADDAASGAVCDDVVSDAASSTATNGIVQLAESRLGDEEVHAMAALVRGTKTIRELDLRGNRITDGGARALASVLRGPSALRRLDLRENHVSAKGIRLIAESLDRADRVRRVYVHAGGKVEALGPCTWASARSSAPTEPDTTGEGHPGGEAATAPAVATATVCVVDVRENSPLAAHHDGAAEKLVLERSPTLGVPKTPTIAVGSMATTVPLSSTRDCVERVGGLCAAATTGRLDRKPGKKSRKVRSRTSAAKGSSLGRSKHPERGQPSRRREDDAKRRKKQRKLEAGWRGRAGGLDVSATLGDPSRRADRPRRRRDLPPLQQARGASSLEGSAERSTSASVVRRAGGRGEPGTRALDASPLAGAAAPGRGARRR